ncbi:hypothetical protein [Neptunicella marina]|uniref:Uncharacterized protein n=1 Tax=Neptunicella marina TaxID=2125989 RepID=A0A8J6IRV6_9ALTE|nr:hypothetical protein [Neptunicella marina]MBC3764263.1 hypothetical protein [Neptunicella marina]
MANLLATQNEIPFFGIQQFHISQRQSVQQIYLRSTQRKWTYILSDHIKASADLPYCIKLHCDDAELRFSWLEKIIKAGQAHTLVVDYLPQQPQQLKHLQQLCQQYKVLLLVLHTQKTDNLVWGHW